MDQWCLVSFDCRPEREQRRGGEQASERLFPRPQLSHKQAKHWGQVAGRGLDENYCPELSSALQRCMQFNARSRYSTSKIQAKWERKGGGRDSKEKNGKGKNKRKITMKGGKKEGSGKRK